MPIALSSLRPKRSHRHSSYTPTQRDIRQRSSYLQDKRWKPYRNNPQLALQVYELTHQAGRTFAERERETDANQLRLYQSVALSLSEMLAEDPANAEKLLELVDLQ